MSDLSFLRFMPAPVDQPTWADELLSKLDDSAPAVASDVPKESETSSAKPPSAFRR